LLFCLKRERITAAALATFFAFSIGVDEPAGEPGLTVSVGDALPVLADRIVITVHQVFAAIAAVGPNLTGLIGNALAAFTGVPFGTVHEHAIVTARSRITELEARTLVVFFALLTGHRTNIGVADTTAAIVIVLARSAKLRFSRTRVAAFVCTAGES
jgi:hypothetical protein